MNQKEFTDLKPDDYVYIIYKGHITKVKVASIFDHGRQKKEPILFYPGQKNIYFGTCIVFIRKLMFNSYEMEEQL